MNDFYFQAIPFFPNPMIQWPNNPLMDPSMVREHANYQLGVIFANLFNTI